MKQILHIFRKDLRHFWPEIAIPIALVALLALLGPGIWRDSLTSSPPHQVITPAGPTITELLLLLLIPASWWLLIARAVHEERLVGDRQFWITRPYEWRKLLAAKGLLIFAFVVVPLVAAQWWLLYDAGLHPATHIGAIAFDWLLLTAFPILPLASLAAVTRNFARMTLTLLAILVCAGIATSILTVLFQHGSMTASLENNDSLSSPFLFVVCASVIIYMYAARRVVFSRAVLLSLPLVLVAFTVFFSSDGTTDHNYPSSQSTGLELSLASDNLLASTVHQGISPRYFHVELPLAVAGVQPGDIWIGKGIRISIEDDGVSIWQSHWQPLYDHYFPPVGSTTFGFDIDRSIYERVKSQAVTLHVELALKQAHETRVETDGASLHDLEVPGLGVCSPIIDPDQFDVINGRSSPQIVGFNCRSALRDPQLTHAQALWTYGKCGTVSNPGELPKTVQGQWIGTLKDSPSDLEIAPVKVSLMGLSSSSYNSNGRVNEFAHVCPGDPLTFTQYELVRNTRGDVTLTNFHFPAYELPRGAGQ